MAFIGEWCDVCHLLGVGIKLKGLKLKKLHRMALSLDWLEINPPHLRHRYLDQHHSLLRGRV